MSNKSPGYKSYKIEGSNLSIPGWLVKHRGEAIDKAVSASRNALVAADAERNKVFRDTTAKVNPKINPSSSFTILSIIPTPVPDLEHQNLDSNADCLDNQFHFSLIDERFIDHKLNYESNELREFLKYKGEFDNDYLEQIIAEYRISNPTLSTLWGTIKAARDSLQSEPFNISKTGDPHKVLLVGGNDQANSKDSWKPYYGKISEHYLEDQLNDIIVCSVDNCKTCANCLDADFSTTLPYSGTYKNLEGFLNAADIYNTYTLTETFDDPNNSAYIRFIKSDNEKIKIDSFEISYDLDRFPLLTIKKSDDTSELKISKNESEYHELMLYFDKDYVASNIFYKFMKIAGVIEPELSQVEIRDSATVEGSIEYVIQSDDVTTVTNNAGGTTYSIKAIV